jgi:LysM repeat protein
MRLGLAFLLMSLTPLGAQSSQLAGMQQDLADLKTEVEKLKLENQDLRESLSRQRASAAPASSASEANAKQRKEVLDEVDRRLKNQTKEVNAALAELTRQVNATLTKNNTAPVKSKSAAPATNGETPVSTEEPTTTEMPQTGVTYKVVRGDSVTRIAKRFNSKAEWILQANKLPNAAALKADVEIFVPQSETPAQ